MDIVELNNIGEDERVVGVVGECAVIVAAMKLKAGTNFNVSFDYIKIMNIKQQKTIYRHDGNIIYNYISDKLGNVYFLDECDYDSSTMLKFYAFSIRTGEIKEYYSIGTSSTNYYCDMNNMLKIGLDIIGHDLIWTLPEGDGIEIIQFNPDLKEDHRYSITDLINSFEWVNVNPSNIFAYKDLVLLNITEANAKEMIDMNLGTQSRVVIAKVKEQFNCGCNPKFEIISDENKIVELIRFGENELYVSEYDKNNCTDGQYEIHLKKFELETQETLNIRSVDETFKLNRLISTDSIYAVSNRDDVSVYIDLFDSTAEEVVMPKMARCCDINKVGYVGIQKTTPEPGGDIEIIAQVGNERITKKISGQRYSESMKYLLLY